MTGIRTKLSTSLSLTLVLVAGLFSSALNAASDREAALIERIKPAGSVCVDGEDCGIAITKSDDGGETVAKSGESIYQKNCLGCHASGAAGAPKMGDSAAWTARLEKGMDMLVANAVNGIGGMPPKGLCMDCSEDDIESAVQYMLDGSK